MSHSYYSDQWPSYYYSQGRRTSGSFRGSDRSYNDSYVGFSYPSSYAQGSRGYYPPVNTTYDYGNRGGGYRGLYTYNNNSSSNTRMSLPTSRSGDYLYQVSPTYVYSSSYNRLPNYDYGSSSTQSVYAWQKNRPISDRPSRFSKDTTAPRVYSFGKRRKPFTPWAGKTAAHEKKETKDSQGETKTDAQAEVVEVEVETIKDPAIEKLVQSTNAMLDYKMSLILLALNLTVDLDVSARKSASKATKTTSEATVSSTNASTSSAAISSDKPQSEPDANSASTSSFSSSQAKSASKPAEGYQENETQSAASPALRRSFSSSSAADERSYTAEDSTPLKRSYSAPTRDSSFSSAKKSRWGERDSSFSSAKKSRWGESPAPAASPRDEEMNADSRHPKEPYFPSRDKDFSRRESTGSASSSYRDRSPPRESRFQAERDERGASERYRTQEFVRHDDPYNAHHSRSQQPAQYNDRRGSWSHHDPEFFRNRAGLDYYDSMSLYPIASSGDPRDRDASDRQRYYNERDHRSRPPHMFVPPHETRGYACAPDDRASRYSRQDSSFHKSYPPASLKPPYSSSSYSQRGSR